MNARAAMSSESSRMSSAAEARFRIQAQPPTSRVITVIDLDAASDHEVARIVDEIPETDLAVMIVAAGHDAHAAAIVGQACSARRVMTHTIIVQAASASDAALARTLAQVRPWSLMVVVVNDDDYVDDVLRSFR
jgi:hypothetical protein